MAQEDLIAVVNMSEGSEEQSRADQASSSNTTAISEYHSVQSSGNSSTNPNVTSSNSSVYYSARIQSMIENRSNFSSEVEFDIEYSRDHWSELTDSDTDNASTRLANREHFEILKKHPEWGGFFRDVKVVLGEKINEGGQAEIYDAKVEFEDGRKCDYGYHVVKVMKGDCPLQDFQQQWPVGMLCNASKDRFKGPLMWIEGGTMIDNRFAFVMVRQWGDLRKLIDMKMQLNNNQGPPFENVGFMKKVMLCIARDMDILHRKYGIVHRDLKASNVLLWSLGDELPDSNPHIQANVVDYECSVGVMGTGFWRAPEILQQLKDRIARSDLEFSKMTDVYSYGMTCYEFMTGCTPFEGHSTCDYDLVLQGNTPTLPNAGTFDHYCISEIIKCCWEYEPLGRPTFCEIVEMLEKADSSQFKVKVSFMEREEWADVMVPFRYRAKRRNMLIQEQEELRRANEELRRAIQEKNLLREQDWRRAFYEEERAIQEEERAILEEEQAFRDYERRRAFQERSTAFEGWRRAFQELRRIEEELRRAVQEEERAIQEEERAILEEEQAFRDYERRRAFLEQSTTFEGWRRAFQELRRTEEELRRAIQEEERAILQERQAFRDYERRRAFQKRSTAFEGWRKAFQELRRVEEELRRAIQEENLLQEQDWRRAFHEEERAIQKEERAFQEYERRRAF